MFRRSVFDFKRKAVHRIELNKIRTVGIFPVSNSCFFNPDSKSSSSSKYVVHVCVHLICEFVSPRIFQCKQRPFTFTVCIQFCGWRTSSLSSSYSISNRPLRTRFPALMATSADLLFLMSLPASFSSSSLCWSSSSLDEPTSL